MKKIVKFLKRGNGELLGFSILLPLFVWLILLMVSIAQIGLAKEKLEYTTYSASRAAVVSEDYASALNNANVVATETLEGASYTDVTTDISMSGVSDPTTALWVKGVYIKVTVSCKVKTIMPISNGSVHESSIYVMVERPANSS